MHGLAPRSELIPAGAGASPLFPRLGVKLLLPPPDGIGDFRQFVELLEDYGYNTVMLEVGGAMEYRRHPEINAAWVSYCREMNEYPGKTLKIQNGFAWPKNSIHSSNGGGRCLTQDQVRELVACCRERGLEAIPEVPSLSHCDYLVLAHPGIRERADDPYPDTYCPSNPASYDLLFDVLQEVVEVFAPRTVHIGHDEYYSIGLCPRCRGRDAAGLYADDISRIHGWLSARGLRTMMWAEKLLDARDKSGTPIGGAAKPHTPATWRAIDLVPRDIDMMHWYWAIDRRLEDAYFARGFDVTYGNFAPAAVPGWPDRIRRPGFRGVMVSNWGATDPVTLQRNGILFDVALSALMARDPCFEEARFDEARERVFDDLYARRRLAQPAVRERIAFEHTTDERRPYTAFVDGVYVDEARDRLGHYRVRFADGADAVLPVTYGLNISSSAQDWGRPVHRLYDCYDANASLAEVAWTTRPFRSSGATWYRTEFPHPRPGVAIRDITFVPAAGGSAGLKWRLEPPRSV